MKNRHAKCGKKTIGKNGKIYIRAIKNALRNCRTSVLKYYFQSEEPEKNIRSRVNTPPLTLILISPPYWATIMRILFIPNP